MLDAGAVLRSKAQSLSMPEGEIYQQGNFTGTGIFLYLYI